MINTYRKISVVPRAARGFQVVLLALVFAYACSDSVAPDGSTSIAVIPIQLSTAPGLATLVVEITASDIGPPLVYNVELSAGTASDTLTIPAGSNRTITVRGYDANSIETHRGSVAIDLVEGPNPAVTIRLDPLQSSQPITVVLGTITIAVSPPADTVTVGNTVQLTATVTGEAGDTLDLDPHWATLHPTIATVDTTGLVTGETSGSATIVATFGGVGDLASIDVTPAP